ncbi:hypothetical protein [Fuchsiella alkaliacetigena]|uniref:hypothetical protein n=1 Tax=Fuchsiella alkaliacetigena TaxID=957042 RepID=UPI00200B8FA8|nr:hypothetical protein [Fuchsiella alkaliacetigena]MCK8824729.1 hypothetical protein [Fuchsiella alkaliacetigena]
MRFMKVISSNIQDEGIVGVESEAKDGVIMTDYPCKIDESVSYDTGEDGESYEGSAKLKGQLTQNIKKGYILEDENGLYKIVTVPKLGRKWLRAELVKLG